MSIAKKSHSRPGRHLFEKAGPPAADETSDEALFVRGVMIRGEAATTEDGELPAGATHEIVPGEEAGDPPKLVRRRYSTV
jgi:hypothetical protein